MTTTKNTAHWTLEALAQAGVKTIVFSPGSRNAPLIIAAEALGTFEMMVLGDERSAAFHALGRSQVTEALVAICCTSGSALANYYPAVLEAYYAHVPLIVLSADRPEDRINKGEGQTCVQREFYEPHVAASVQLNEEDSYEQVQSALHYAIQAMHFEMRPIHLNVAFHEPLYEQGEAPKSMQLNIPEDTMTKYGLPSSPNFPSLEGVESVAVIAGQLSPKNSQAVRAVLEAGVDWTLFADPMSGVLDHPSAVRLEDIMHHRPKAIISIGGQWINKKPKEYLRSLGIDHHIHLDLFQCWDVLDAEVEHLRVGPDYLANFAKASQFIHAPKKNTVVPNLHWSDGAAFQMIVESLGTDTVLHLGNSSIARYFNYFARPVQLYSNRGVAGIDGSLSAAVGAALADSGRAHTVILGDQSFLYDHNGLYASELPQNLKIYVLNNGVGGIFDWLPGTAKTGSEARRVFANAQNMDFAGLAAAFGVAYKEVSTKEALERALGDGAGIALVNCKTDQDINLKVFKTLEDGIA